MPAIEVGRKCVRTRGRKAGEAVIIKRVIDKNFVEVEDSKRRLKKCNIMHLEPVKSKMQVIS